MMKSIALNPLYQSISRVSTEAVLNQLQIKKPSLRQYLQSHFTQGYGLGGGFLADPLIESTFSWASAFGEHGDNTMNGLAEQGILSPTLVDVMDRAPVNPCKRAEDEEQGIERVDYDESITEDEDSRWPADRAPYTHQLEAWKILGKETPQSAVVAAGTGSGKSECFMVPMLNDMARQVDSHDETLVGVQAIMLYPLNALINSQRDRLIGWTRGFEGKVRFALYNGETPLDSVGQHSKAQQSWFGAPRPEEVKDRKSIRKSPPPILVTNATMLEYMLVRPEDRPIIEKSKGTLRWIILDEAHTLIGSAAAETSLLLRRTMYAFGVEPKDVRFVATSATIGDQSKQQETDEKLKVFLSDLAGVSIDQISVVRGRRHIPELPEPKGEPKDSSLETLVNLSPAEAYDTLSQMPLMRSFREHLVKAPMTLREISALLHPGTEDAALTNQQIQTTLQLVDIATDAYPGGDTRQDAFLPIRAHLFHRAQSGIWACVNPECLGKQGSPLEINWPFGKVYLTERQVCKCCNHPVYELTHCAKCNEPSLSGVRYITDTNLVSFKPRELPEIDEYSDEVEHGAGEPAEDTVKEKRDELVQIYSSHSEIHDRHVESGGSVEAWLKAPSGEVSHTETDGVKIFYCIAQNGSELRCACCNTVESEDGRVFKRAILGSPFLMGNIVPEMLRHVPAPSLSSMAGRRLITFSDSRQGTARFSARLQLDAERRWSRSVVYRHLIKQAPEVAGISPETQEEIDIFEAKRLENLDNEFVLEMIDDKLAQLRGTSVAKSEPVLWSDLVSLFSETEEIRLLSGHGEFRDDMLPGEYAQREGDLGSPKALARLFLLREFARRPLNSNNLESLGLVRIVYPALNTLKEGSERARSRVWFDLGFTFDQWLSFLKIFLDFFVREETMIDLKPFEKNWMGAQLYARLLQPQNFIFDTDPDIKKQQRAAYKVVPSSRESRPHRLVRLLELGSKRSVVEVAGQFDQILSRAFETLKDLELLEWAEFDERDLKVDGKQISFKRQGYQLKFESLAFELIDTAYLCPLTQRWIDNPMRGPGLDHTHGITPLTTGGLLLDDVLIKEDPVQMPRPDKALLRLDPESVVNINEWIAASEEIGTLRDSGLWRDLNDAALKPPALIRSREHSAQQASEKLKQFEKAFKNDALNVLNCSTTMEMGVDIGSLSMVAMNNAPPSTANYLQRAGRAGRRGQSTSIVLTFCKATPHGERIFADPRWPFSATPVPKVALDSAIIVRRHVNAYLLAQYLVTSFADESLPKLKAGKFFLSDYDSTKAELFVAWLGDTALSNAPLLAGLRTLVSGTALEGLSDASIIQNCQEQMKDVMAHWLNRYHALEQVIEDSDSMITIDESGKKRKDYAYRRLEKQLSSMATEYLLSLLANRGFLPGYGFPTNVVELVTNNASEARNKSTQTGQRPGYPTRSLDVAIREYAPGKDLVLNGAVYRSAGLQLAWKVPESEAEVKQHQSLRYVAYCECGYHSAEHDSTLDLPGNCPECKSSLRRMEYLIPTGFQVDYKASLHNDYTRPEYAEYKEPLVSVDDADWQSLGKLDYGRFRATQFGNLFHYNDGYGAGFAFCWHCGRTHAIETKPDFEGNLVVPDSERTRITAKHRRLSGTRKNDNPNCPNEAWSIKAGKINDETQAIDMPVVFGFATTTTMLELQLRNPTSHSWINSKTLGTSLGTAMRIAFCELEGVAESELGISVQTRTSPEGVSTTSIFIFDKASQGAGYATQIAERLPEVLDAAYRYVKRCTSSCDKACHACLLDFETQHQIENLDRYEVIKFFTETHLLGRLLVPEHRRYFGGYSLSELLNAQSLLSIKGTRAQEIDLFISGTDWEVAKHPVLRKLKFLSNQKVRVLIADTITGSIDSELAWQLQRTLDESVTVESYTHPGGLPQEVFPVLRMIINGKDHWYVTDDPNTTSLNDRWGMTEEESLVTNGAAALDVFTSPLNLAEKASGSAIASNMGIIEDVSSLNSHISRFGDNFTDLILETTPSLEEALSKGIERVVYLDRYLRSPITLMMIVEIFRGLQGRFGTFSCEIETCYPTMEHKTQTCVADDFTQTNDWLDFVSGAGSVHSLNVLSEFKEKRDIHHGRALVITTTAGETYRLLFDQGLGHWGYRSLYNRNRFDFGQCYAEGESYTKAEITVRGGSRETYIVIHKKE
jgi:ATP-dependent helicase YprA (DUF1998 family)